MLCHQKALLNLPLLHILYIKRDRGREGWRVWDHKGIGGEEQEEAGATTSLLFKCSDLACFYKTIKGGTPGFVKEGNQHLPETFM
jgi:hypothetical protein